MPRDARPRGPAPIADHLRFRLLPYDVEVAVDDPAALAHLRYLANSVEQDGVPVDATLRWAVRGTGPWELSEEGDVVGRYGTLDDVLYVLYERCYGRLGRRLADEGWVSLHGGLVSIGGRRAVVVGDKGAGKTTLMMRLLLDGHAVEGDEQVLTRDGSAMALPRAFHVKPGTAEVLEPLAAALAASPATAMSDGTPIVGFDPRTAGYATATRPGPVDVAVVLRGAPDPARPPRLRPVSTVDVVASVVTHALVRDEARGPLLAACATLLAEATGYELEVGELGATAAALAAAIGDP